ncbi:MAG: PAS domain-containing protein [Nitrosomonadales bacterium]|nr:PAS domain-containing protein [Nitrosomonadales bacterium]
MYPAPSPAQAPHKGIAVVTKKSKAKATDKPAAPKNPKSQPTPKSRLAPKSRQAQESQPSQEAHIAGFHIVGMGASAGGLEAFEQFFRSVSPDSGMAFVLVSHLDPSHASILTEILQRTTVMPVAEAQDQMAVAPNGVYVIPPNRDMAIFHGVLQLSVPEQPRGQRMPIDAFLRSLAEDQGENAIGVILSGTGTDGTLGLRAILGAGGVSLVQEPATAKYDGMPASAIQSGYATHVLPVEKMPEVLLASIHTLAVHQETPPAPAAVSGMKRILMQLRSATGHDFTQYKKSTIGRRIERRMSMHNIEDMEVYARYLKEHPAEVKSLFNELLINVTSFFRDAEAFATFKRDIIPLLFEGKPEGYVFRVWVAGCASGEEAYSIAIMLREFMDETRQEFKIQLYSTDLDEDAIAVARAGIYPPNIAQDVAPERLRRFFIKEEAGYRVKKDIREMVVFATQNVIKDPPFTKLDLLSCRNLMIYLEPELQNRLIPAFHYALKPGGILFLSPSESIGNHPVLFAPLNRKWKFYRATGTVASTRAVMSGGLLWTKDPNTKEPDEATKKLKETNFAELTRRVLLQSYAPASVVTDLKGNILFVHGDTGKYLRPAPGQATLNVVEMAREGLQLELRAALNSAGQGAPVPNREVPVKTNGDSQIVSLSLRPLSDPEAGEKLLLVSFQDVAQPMPGKLAPGRRGRGKNTIQGESEQLRIEELERELAYSKENLQATIEEQQASNEELKSTNEELQSTNEELQSTNEELETSKEELQSVNEELITVNTELQAKIEQLAGMQNDMKNLLDNINTGTIFLDERMNIKRFTREAAQVYRLAASDVGRPLGDIKSNIEDEDLLADAQTVLDTLAPCEREVHTTGGAWYLARIQPYRTLDNVIEGVVLTFVDISDFKRTSKMVKRSEAMLATALRIANLGCWEWDVDADRASWSPEMYDIFGYPGGSTPLSFKDFLEILRPEDREPVAAAMRATVTAGAPYDVEYKIMRPDGTTRNIRARGEAIANSDGRVTRVIGTVLNVPECCSTPSASPAAAATRS